MFPTIASIIITVFLLNTIYSLKHSEGLKITTPLIHRDSIYSPLYNSSQTIADRAKRAVQLSLARHAYRSTLSSKNTPSGIKEGLVFSMRHNLFHVNLSIGQPPVPQLVIMDTGSEMLWVKCFPCSPCSQVPSVTLFDPLKSKTYVPRPCTRACPKCSGKDAGEQPPVDCMYEIYYIDDTHSEGVYATDQLTFSTSDDGFVTIPDMQFGCSSLISGIGNQDDIINGVFGLSGSTSRAGLPYGEKPPINKLGFHFSYCIGSIFDSSYPYNHLTIGDESDLLGYSTPYHNNPRGDYFVQLTNISLGGKQTLDIEDRVFRMMSAAGIVVDSGSNIMLLHRIAFEVVKAQVKKMASSILTIAPVRESFELCYKGSVNVDARGFPVMALQFMDDVVVEMNNEGMFIQVDDNTFCLAIVRSSDISVIGIMAQQGYNVGYDLKALRIYFQPLDCQNLEERRS
ncbi:Probable aspartic protease At2g35615 [Linum perenne]